MSTLQKVLSSVILATALSLPLSANSLIINPTPTPADDIQHIQTYMNNIFNHMMRDNNFLNINSYPNINIQEKNNKYIIKFELAGMDKKDIKLSISDNNILSVEGEKKYNKEDKKKDFIKQEIYYGKFKRMIQLPKDINVDKMKSKFKNGELTVTVPKKHIKKPFYKKLFIE